MAELHQWETVYDNGKVGVAHYAVTRFRVPSGWIYEFPPKDRCVFVPDLGTVATDHKLREAEDRAVVLAGVIDEAIEAVNRPWLAGQGDWLERVRRCVRIAESVQEFGHPHAVVIPPFRNVLGSLCGTCDGTDAHEHPRVRCSRCGREGLRENWPFECCVGAKADKKESSDG